MTTPAHSGRFLNLAVLAIVNLLWAAQYPAYKVASDHMSPASLNFWTLVCAVLLLVPFLAARWKRGGRPASGQDIRKTLRQYLLMGLFGIIPPSVLLAWGVAHSSASNAAILSLTIPVLMTGMGMLMLRERITALRAFSLLLGLAGTVMLSLSDFRSASFGRGVLLGNLVIFVAGMGSAFYNTYGKALLQRFGELEVLLYSYLSGAMFCAVISAAVDNRPFFLVNGYPASAWIAVLVLGALSWGIAMVLWMWVLNRLEVVQVSVSIYLLPFFGVLLSAIALRERPTWVQGAGGALVVLGTLLVSEYEGRRKLQAERQAAAMSPAGTPGLHQ
jgi:drug/metabolite transporter (DMT)-like permease